MTDVVFWQIQSFCCNVWLKNGLKLWSSSSLTVQAVRHVMDLLLSALVPNTCPTLSCPHVLLFTSYSADLTVSFATQHQLSDGCPPSDLLLTCLGPLMFTWQVAGKVIFFSYFWWDLVPLSCFLFPPLYSSIKHRQKMSWLSRHPTWCWGCPTPVLLVPCPFRAQILKTFSK